MAEFRHGRLALTAPDNWQDVTALVICGPYDPATRTQPQVQVARTQMDEPQPAEVIGGLFADNLPQAIEDAQILQRRNVALEGLDGFLVVFEMGMEGGAKATRMQLFATRGNELFTAAADCTSENYPKLGPTLIGVLESLTLRRAA